MGNRPRLGEHIAPDRTLLGPGPSDMHPRVYGAMSQGMVGYLDDSYTRLMDEVQAALRYLFRTDNRVTLAVSGTGSAAMETALTNLLEPGETALVPGNGFFGERMGQIARRAGADVATVDAPWGEPLTPSAVEAALETHKPAVFGFVHGETSTGVRQPAVETLASLAHEHDAIVVADTVASLGGVEFRTDAWDVDVVYAGSQKCLSAPPGVSPITVSDRAFEKIQRRDSPVRSWYLDLEGIWEYWDDDPSYHHTGPISTMYALREALRLVCEEGIEARWDRHRRVAGALRSGIEGLGLSLAVEPDAWLPTLNPVSVPPAVDGEQVIGHLMREHDIEIVGGLGALAGEIFRVGCMGHSARPANVTTFVPAFGSALRAAGGTVDIEAGAAAAAGALS